MTFNQALISSSFPSEWKKTNIVHVHRKCDKQTLKNYRPVSLPPICGKIFKRLVFLTKCIDFFLIINWLQRTSTVSNLVVPIQLLLITQEVYKFFGEGRQVRGVLLDISKAFDKVWDERVIFKLEQNDISGDILNILRDLINKKQIVVFNGQVSTLKVLM